MTAPDSLAPYVGTPRVYLRPVLLLLLAEGTSHGYELLEQVSDLGMGRVDPGGLYRCLRSMDEDGLVTSRWEPSSSGPARRTYSITERGFAFLDEVAQPLADVADALARHQQRYRALRRTCASVNP